ncbi:MAG TPA: NAD(P)H-dependent oxidoreductase [Candidatus Thermoplasmatota archaeon]|nr:NAD(P)H-dependent oxidoreductase [Candidatus Thermoplasmatota archaeon]
MYLPVILGTSREGNRSAWVARYVEGRLREPGLETRLFTAARLGLGDLRRREWEEPQRAPALDEFVREMARADGFVLVFPEYNHGYPGALKNILDHVYDEWNRKPFAFVSTGGVSGGMRAQENLAPVIRALKGAVVPAGVAVASVSKAFSRDGPVDAAAWERRVDAMIDDLLWWARALAEARARGEARAEERQQVRPEPRPTRA